MAVINSSDIDPSVPPPQGRSSNSANNLRAVRIVLISVAFGAVGQLVLKAAMNSLGGLQFSVPALLQMATNPLLIVGLGIFFLSTVFWLLALTKADLSFVYPFLSLTYIAVLVGGALLFHEQVTVPRIVGFIVIIVGVFIVARSEKSA